MTPLEALLYKDNFTLYLQYSILVASNGVIALERLLPTRKNLLIMNSLLPNALTG